MDELIEDKTKESAVRIFPKNINDLYNLINNLLNDMDKKIQKMILQMIIINLS